MREAIRPRLHLFVCANRRTDSPLGPGCGDHGEAVYNALKSSVTDVAKLWITKTHCLGICPKSGCTVARYPEQKIFTDVTTEDLPALFAGLTENDASASVSPAVTRELESLEELQRKKVLDLARRLKPGLTLEDVQNPHDFPELDDPDWHYADGVLGGISSVKMTLAAIKKRDS